MFVHASFGSGGLDRNDGRPDDLVYRIRNGFGHGHLFGVSRSASNNRWSGAFVGITMTFDQTIEHGRRVRKVKAAFGGFDNMKTLAVEFVDTFQEAGATSAASHVQLRVTRDWEETVARYNLAEVSRVFPVAVEALEPLRPDVSLWRARCVPFYDLTRQSEPNGPWLPTGERLLAYVRTGFEEGFLARTACGLGLAFHETALGAVRCAVRRRGRRGAVLINLLDLYPRAK